LTKVYYGQKNVKHTEYRLNVPVCEKGKVQFFLSSGAEVYFHSFLPSAIDGDILAPLLSSLFTASKRISGPQCTGEWASLSDRLDFLKEK
jgi:hypothetical protein